MECHRKKIIRNLQRYPILLLGLIACFQSSASDVVFFESRIRPTLSDHCYDCHGSNSNPIRGNLRVDSRDGLLIGGDRGPAIRPGHSDESLLIQAITHDHPELAMPHKRPKLPDATIHNFRKWINEGARWPAFSESSDAASSAIDLQARKSRLPWIWESPTHHSAPETLDKDWAIEKVDEFVLHALEQEKLEPATDATPEIWLRRVSFTLTGLPPSTDLQQAFLTQDSPKTKAWVVDTLLASPHFGERWARHWMDLMRYAESRGHESDYIITNAHHYRDYLIRAFNTDLPYDAFVKEHLAGDLLSPPRTRPGNGANESILATGWAFLGEEVHSPVDIRQDECDRIDNKVDVFSKSFLGLTVACARCHDHKFDAIRAKDYYALSGFFLSSSYQQVRFESMENNQSIVNELETLREKHQETIRATWKQWSKSGPEFATKNFQSAILQIRQTQEGTHEPGENDWIDYILHAAVDENDSFQAWAQVLTGIPRNKHIPNSEQSISIAVQDPMHNADVILNFTDQPDQDTHEWRSSGPGFGTHPVRPGDFIWEEETNRASIALQGAARRDPFWKDLATSDDNQNDPGSLAATSRAGQMIRTRTFTLKSGRLHYLIRGATRVYAAVDSHILITGPLHGSLVKTFDTKDSTTPRWVTHSLDDYQGHRVHLEFGPVDDRAIEILKVVDSSTQPAPPIQTTWPVPENLDGKDSSKSWAPIFKEILSNTAKAISIGDVSKLPHGPIIAQWMMNHANLLGIQNALKTIYTDYKKESDVLRNQVQWKSKTTVAWLDGNGVDERVLLRGKPHNKGDLAPRALPEAWPTSSPLSDPNSSGRLELAKQLTHPSHPLIARVMVNRVWHHLFGHGIVSSVDNFGYLGNRPSHPEMLDQLTWQFVHEQGWSLKRLIRGLVLSRTFGMSSVPSSPHTMDVDPTNRLWHHYPVRRLEAEAIRDALLTVSGRLVPDLYGRPVPVHLTEFVVGRGRPSVSGPLDGEGRRSIYTAVRRNFLPTFMRAFDFPTPFSTMGKRNVTNVPAQSLALMNDALVHDQARFWAQRVLSEQASQPNASRIENMFRTAYGRGPSNSETEACLQMLTTLQESEPPTEAWSHLAHALLSSNEFVFIR